MAVPLDDSVLLRPPAEADAPGLVRAVHGSLAVLVPWMPWATAGYDEEGARAWIASARGLPNHEFLLVAKATSEVLGACGLNSIGGGVANLGYWLAPVAQGRGVATLAARWVARHGLRDLGLQRIEIKMSVENEASRRVAERVGARHLKVQQRALPVLGRDHDVHVFILEPSDLPRLR